MRKECCLQVLFLSVLSIFLIFACDEKPKNPVAEYGDALVTSYKKGQIAGEEANLDAVRKSIEAYHATNDRYPQSLDEIKDLFGQNEIDLSKYDYNPQNGEVSVKK
ncbi:MAG: hypothetical protein A2Y97_07775 [Nitrospirae bacterium RBG_13_39_12]|nr:MAG: hypothetical protein A2Y97_07775 [Nitrospirae bacterium RBG_13_39_12]